MNTFMAPILNRGQAPIARFRYQAPSAICCSSRISRADARALILRRWYAERGDEKLLDRLYGCFVRRRVIGDLRTLLDARVVQVVRLTGLAVEDRAVLSLLEETAPRGLRLRKLDRFLQHEGIVGVIRARILGERGRRARGLQAGHISAARLDGDPVIGDPVIEADRLAGRSVVVLESDIARRVEA